jgi:hypothetical protein
MRVEISRNKQAEVARVPELAFQFFALLVAGQFELVSGNKGIFAERLEQVSCSLPALRPHSSAV